MTTAKTAAARVGDHVQVVGHRVGDAPRSGEIVEVLGEAQHPHFQVRWEDGRTSLLYPGADIAITPATTHRASKK